MATVADVLEGKGRSLYKIEADASVLDAVRAMVEANVGSLLVTDGGGIEGIVTERDYLRRVTLEGRDERDAAEAVELFRLAWERARVAENVRAER